VQRLLILLSLIDAGTRWRQSTLMSDKKPTLKLTQLHSCAKRALELAVIRFRSMPIRASVLSHRDV